MTHRSDPADAPATAAVVARRAAERAGVTVVQLHDVDALQRVCDLFVEVWRTRRMDPPVNRDLMRALAHAGAYVAAAYAGDVVVGGSVGFFAADGTLHSHISGVASGTQGLGVGRALKLDQRAWCLERGVTTVTWTFDPLVRRNAWFNLTKLGALCDEYLPDFYGAARDGVNAGDATDRLRARWDLTSARAVQAADGALAPPDVDAVLRAGGRVVVDALDDSPVLRTHPDDGSPALLVGTPADVVEMRGRDPERASAWRRAVRAAIEPAVARGYLVTGITRTGCYVLTPKDGNSL